MDFLAEQVSVRDVKEGYGSLIFIGVFALVLAVVVIWWLRRQV